MGSGFRSAKVHLQRRLFFIFIRLLPATASLPDELHSLGNVALVGFGGGVLFLVTAYFARDPVLRIVKRILDPISEGVSTKVVGLISTFVEGIGALRSVPRFLGFVGTTAIFWAVNGGITWVLAESYVDGLPVLAGPFTIGVTVFAVMIPAGPAFAGTLEAGFRLGLSPFGVDVSSAAAIAVVAHVGHLLFMAAIAGLGLLVRGRQEGRVAVGFRSSPSSPSSSSSSSLSSPFSSRLPRSRGR